MLLKQLDTSIFGDYRYIYRYSQRQSPRLR